MRYDDMRKFVRAKRIIKRESGYNVYFVYGFLDYFDREVSKWLKTQPKMGNYLLEKHKCLVTFSNKQDAVLCLMEFAQ